MQSSNTKIKTVKTKQHELPIRDDKRKVDRKTIRVAKRNC